MRSCALKEKKKKNGGAGLGGGGDFPSLVCVVEIRAGKRSRRARLKSQNEMTYFEQTLGDEAHKTLSELAGPKNKLKTYVSKRHT